MNIFMRTPNISQMNNLVWSSQSCQSHQSLNLFLSFVLLWAAFSQWSFSFTAFASSSSYPFRRLSPPIATLRSSANRLVGDELFPLKGRCQSWGSTGQRDKAVVKAYSFPQLWVYTGGHGNTGIRFSKDVLKHQTFVSAGSKIIMSGKYHSSFLL